MYFRYPLAGQFQASAIVTEGNWAEGGFVYDGILMESHAYDQSLLKLHVARPQHNPSQVNLAVGGTNPTHLDLRIEGGKSLFRINRHVANTDTLSGASPFFAVKASGGWTPGFRDLKLTGNPEIPRKVELLQDHRLRGWMSYYNENLTSAFVEEPADKTYDWQLQDGVLNAKSNPDMGSAESLLTYLRPMLSGEKISWEFRYLPGIENCHPALGRLAFLLKPDGVQLHWITDGDLEWSLLTADNAVVESASQRGGKLPLLENDWNKAELKLAGRRVQLVLNGELVMEREHELSLQTQFGLFRNRLSESVSARNIELTGDWPKSFAEASAGGLLALETSERSVQDRHAIAEAIGEQQYNLMGYQVSRDSELLPPKERLDLLKRWVLPGDDKFYVRDQGGFVPSYLYNDAPVAGSHADYVVNKAAGNHAKTAWHRQPGGLVSPALDLVFAAAELGELDQLKHEVVKISNDYRQSQNVRSCNAILSAIATAEGDFATANALIDGIYERVKVSTQTTVRLRWSALVAAWNAIQFPETIDGGLRILDHMVDQQFNRGMSTGWEFDHPIRAMRGLARSRWAIAAGLERLLPEDGDWIPVTRVRAQTSALGIGAPHWTQNLYGGATHHSGHEEDFLYYAVPLTGDFTVECEMTSFGWREVRFMYDDHWVGISSDRNKFDHGRSWQTLPSSIFTKTPLDIGDWFQFQLKVENGICSHWVNGTKIFQEQLSEHPDPWLAIRCGANIEGGSIRNLKISGSPTVPDQLELLKQDRLNGWTASHFRQSSSDWKRVSNEIVGVRHPETAYQSRESLLQYHRPLLEDGIIEYDFLYDSEFPDNQRGVHPAIGRLAFVLGTDRVSEHVISNGIYGHDGIDLGNTQVFENYHLSKGPLPLKVGVNHMKVTVKGNELLLNLNDTDIYRRHLSTSDQRFFGFFHYNGVTEARIRNVTYRGAWAREVPSVSKQQFAGVSESFDLRVDSDDASKSIAYSFETDGLTDLLFDSSSNPRNDSVFLVDGAGVHVDYSGGPGWSSKTLSPHLAIEGDFDVTVKFSDLAIKTPDTDKSSGIHLGLTFMSSTKDTVEVMRRMRGNGEHVVESMWVVNAHDGTKYLSTSQPEASSEGRFRLSRRGDVVLWMYAANNDSQFRVVRTERVSDAAVVLESIDFECQVGGAGGVSATWKGFDIRAENLLRSNPSSAR